MINFTYKCINDDEEKINSYELIITISIFNFNITIIKKLKNNY